MHQRPSPSMELLPDRTLGVVSFVSDCRSMERGSCRARLTMCLLMASAGLFVFLSGCGKQVDQISQAASTGTPQSASPQSESSADDIVVEALRVLETSGVKLSINPKTRQISGADFSRLEASDVLVGRLAELGIKESLTHLTIRASSLTAEGWQLLGQHGGLQHLDLRECPMDDASLVALTDSLTQLRSFRLNGRQGNCAVTDQGLEFLGKQTQLKLLAVDGLNVGERVLTYVRDCAELTELYLGWTAVEDTALGQLSGLKKLQKLRLAGCRINGRGLEAIAGLSVEELDLSECSGVGDEAMSYVGAMTKMKRLNLWKTAVSDQGVAPLGQLVGLQWLNLDNTRISDAALPLLSGLKELSFLHLGSTSVSDAGMNSITALSSLKQLVVTRTQVTRQGIAQLQSLLPHIDIQLEYVAGK